MTEKIITIKTSKKDANKIIKEIKDLKNFDNRYKIKTKDENIFIPIKKIPKDINLKKIIYFKNLEKQKQIGKNYKDFLKIENKIPLEIIKTLPSSYDIVGDILIINIENKETIRNHSTKICEALKKVNPHIKVVLNKKKEHHGIYRTQDLEWIWGDFRKETTIIENGCNIKTNVEQVFYSTRLATERKRIAKLVKNDEIIGVFFAGVGPFALTIAKLAKPKEIIAIELNPIGEKYLKENIKNNHFEKIIKPILGDVKEISKKYKNYFDRIPMPLPKSAETFLENAIYSIKNNGIIHIYNFVSKNNPYEELEKIINKKAQENNVKLNIIFKKIIRSFSATTVQIAMDIKIEK
ncbi:MAG: class I SAM-dependent methyltransferase family protein [Candidatus ainarchaeum sp.]|nr:class I SAM-dependent methyltransferase family protein [Candidatus ainarchaeum sp.]MDD3975554.1 class I SAM-dependent methyltransferase family protein [Candidatus ainarchaeum sp.]